jgi:BirA family biotin operon repressor/biotin-[acetyl-CoA-carboxylase] ligase
LPNDPSTPVESFRFSRLGIVGSTNDEAMACARTGDRGFLWLVAEAQTNGRGRHGRAWVSPPGNLYASLLVVDPCPRHHAPELGFVAGCALALALKAILDDDRRIAIKWPNDVLFAGAKLGGILLESSELTEGRFACVAGFGVNCASHPADTLYEATDLAKISGGTISSEIVLERLAGAMSRQLGVWQRGEGFAAIRTEWLGLALGLGSKITVALPGGATEGIFETIDSVGRLLLETSTGRVAIAAGDVFLGPSAGWSDPSRSSIGRKATS